MFFDILFKNKPAISNIEIDSILEETLTAESEITQFPVEKQVDINDHIKLLPYKFVIKGIVSDATTSYSDALRIKNPQKIFEDLLFLRTNKVLFDLLFYEKIFENIVLQSLNVPRDKNSAKGVIFTASFQEVHTVDLLMYYEKYSDQKNKDKMMPMTNTGIRQLS